MRFPCFRRRHLAGVRFGIPHFFILTKEGYRHVASPLTLDPAKIATVPVFGVDKVGNPLPLPAGSTVSSDDAAVSAVMAAGGTQIIVSATKLNGSANVTLSGGGFTDVMPVSLAPVSALAGVTIDVAHAVLSANPSPPTS